MIDGTYSISAKTPLGVISGNITYETNGNELSGSANALDTTVTVQNGICEGDFFEHTLKINTDKGVINVKVKGKVDADNISGTFKMMFVTSRFSGKRL